MASRKDEKLMMECLRLAQKGGSAVSPNPCVGAVIVHKGRVIGTGYHRKFGEAHAEVNAIRDALKRHSTIKNATLYVNLEPCVHHGKTPPCVDAIVKQGISKVVAAMQDPNPLVAGKGFAALRAAGIEVVVGVLKREATIINERFVKYITTGMPFVAIKAAQTRDGFIARKDGSSRWITSKQARRMTHVLRAEYDSVLVGAGTAMADDPRLTVRHVKGRNPYRILVDGRLRTSLTAHLFNDQHRGRTIVFAGGGNLKKMRPLRKKGVDFIVKKTKSGLIPVQEILRELAKRKIASVLVEGGGAMYRQFLRSRSVDKIYLFISDKKFGDGIAGIKAGHGFRRLRRQKRSMIGPDLLIEGYPVYSSAV
ncbi:MAG TPA: bifunctional diaminohydroxyphosphoribosylaminopyrimidine deaminase/5-amino-6-(5-phosphoribosylamino)uracil reductase RibD [Bacteroidota bacterium]|nr:bifunctional diaminohydroxyphosphoribosylaminopyrimidine deaminase/5-amino-6-(5-phosphoribosylamino)uracil reductase RibD [Bacteroidota bacterium]